MRQKLRIAPIIRHIQNCLSELAKDDISSERRKELVKVIAKSVNDIYKLIP